MPQPSSRLPAPALDEIDRAILRELQADGRLTNADLAKRVRLSPSPCLRRLRALEQHGYISGYTAVLDRARMERALKVTVLVELISQRQEVLEAFEAGAGALAVKLVNGKLTYVDRRLWPALISAVRARGSASMRRTC